MRYKRLFLLGLYLGLASITLNGCSMVQWLPSSSCEHVKYERTGDYVEVDAQCRV
jgi:hypothetical protein